MNKVKVDYNIIPIEDVKRKHDGHWFDESNKGFFGSRWDDTAYTLTGGLYAYFVSSEICSDEVRKYSVRRVNMRNGQFSTPYPDEDIFGFQKFASKKQAIKALKNYLVAVDVKVELKAWLVGELEFVQKYSRVALDVREKEIMEELEKLS